MSDYNLDKRRYVIGGVAIAIVVVYIIRLFTLQLLSDDYKKNADSNAFLKKIEYPSRGAISELAIFLSLFLGTMGIHRFYLGYIKIGIVQFILWVLGFFTGGITWIITEVWSFIEFILIFINKIKDSNGNELE